ncbi:MAG TPA: LysR family transcriptional regulator [Ramlibacter sp.]|jgi:DNA-binding transcriptional LysR family regulator|uniref:LysR family transcriptional regulator n=1 Tax=Ramlibacter sp. TaxID=1917967 RepID=UPI002D582622|nr:LysR family transcriptional regulator [Ramlibacter sp.]HZY18737.1 LysR family transcriptional regulator [Ramlibacter sp.]
MSPSVHAASAEMHFFSLLVRSGSLSAAARELQVTPPAVSKRLAQLEQHLGVRLLRRTTRRMGLTAEGEAYLADARRILAEIEDLERRLRGASEQPAGLLRVNATLGFGRMHVAPLIASFVRGHPQVEVQLQLSANPPPLTQDAFDVCVRFGEPPDARVVARLLAPNRRLLCASPGYLQRHGVPRTPADLARHQTIGIRQGDEGSGVWRLRSGRRSETVKVHGGLSTNDGEIAVQWALAGHGIVMRAEWDVARYLQSGPLREVLPAWQTPPADIHAVCPVELQSAARVRAFIDHLAAHFGQAGVGTDRR